MSDRGNIRELVRLAIAQGWRHSWTGANQHRLVPPGPGKIVIGPNTPSDMRAYDNFLAELKRNGFKEPNEREELLLRRRRRKEKRG